MKNPYFNLEQRQLIRYGTLQGDVMLLELAWMKFVRELVNYRNIINLKFIKIMGRTDN